MAGSNGDLNPMHQFEVYPILPIKLGSIDASFTNASLWMVIVVATVCLILLLSSAKLVPGRLQSIGELAYEFIANMMRDILGDSGRAFFPLVFALFMFVLTANLWGMISLPLKVLDSS